MERDSVRFPLCTVSLSTMSASSSASDSDSLESANDLDRAIAACLRTNTNSRQLTIGVPTINPRPVTVPIDASSHDTTVNEPVSNNTSSVLNPDIGKSLSDDRDWTGPNDFFASLPKHHTSRAWLEGEPGALALSLGTSKNGCSDLRVKHHRQELETLKDELNRETQTGGVEVTSFNTVLARYRDKYNDNPKNKHTQIRILGSLVGDQIKTTVLIGDSNHGSLLAANKCYGSAKALTERCLQWAKTIGSEAA